MTFIGLQSFITSWSRLALHQVIYALNSTYFIDWIVFKYDENKNN